MAVGQERKFFYYNFCLFKTGTYIVLKLKSDWKLYGKMKMYENMIKMVFFEIFKKWTLLRHLN